VEKGGLEKIFTIGAVKKGVEGWMGQVTSPNQTPLFSAEKPDENLRHNGIRRGGGGGPNSA